MTQTWKGRSVLVTGGTGFVGSFMVERLLDMGAKVRVPLRAENYRSLSSRRAEIEWLEGDLRDTAYCTRLVEGMDYVFHLAGCRRNSEYHRKRAGDVLNENVRMSLALIEGLKEFPAIPVTFFSTANVPPTLDTVALAQSEKIDGYVLGKALCEALWFAASRQRKFPLLIVRPVGAYGPRDTFTEEGNVIPRLMVRTRDSEESLKVWGDGTEERAFLYVEDLVDAVLRLVAADIQGVHYITSERVVTVRELSECIRDLVQPGLPIVFQPEKRVDERAIPTVPLHPVLQEMRWTPLAEGLKRTYQSWNSL